MEIDHELIVIIDIIARLGFALSSYDKFQNIGAMK